MRKPKTGLLSVPAVQKWLQSKGLKASQAKIYRDITNGLLKRQQTGEFLVADAEAYAETLLHKPGDAGQVDADRAALELKKLQADIARLEGVVRRQDREYEVQTGRLCKSGDFYLAIAERLSILKSRFSTLVRVRAIEYVKMSPDDFVDAISADFALLLHEFSRPPEYDSEEVPDVFKEGRDVAGRTERQEVKHADNDD